MTLTRSRGDYATVAYSAAAGKQQWASRYNGPGNGLGGRRVFVTGQSPGPGSGADYVTNGPSDTRGPTRTDGAERSGRPGPGLTLVQNGAAVTNTLLPPGPTAKAEAALSRRFLGGPVKRLTHTCLPVAAS